MKVALASLVAGALAMGPSDIRLNTVPASDLFAGVEFESGYAKIENQGDMFFWLFPAEEKAEDAPLVMWLNGGPGCSSDFGALKENGPVRINRDGTTSKNEHAWTKVAHMLYVDQPMRVGYSRSTNSESYSKPKVVANNLRLFLENFLEKKPEFKGRKFYISGESYAGHYIPRVGSLLIDKPVDGLNFMGVAIGNGWYSAAVQYPSYSDYGKEIGIISRPTAAITKAVFKTCGPALGRHQKNIAAKLACSIGQRVVFGTHNVYDYKAKKHYDDSDLEKFLQREDVKKALGVEGKWVMCDMGVYTSLMWDIDRDTRPELAHVVTAGKETLIFAGDNDIICNHVGNERVVNSLNDSKWIKNANHRWSQAPTFAKIPMQKDSENLYEYRSLDNVTYMRVYDAGHMVPMDQPEAGLKMMRQFLNGELKPQQQQPERYEPETEAEDITECEEEESSQSDSDLVQIRI